MKSASRNLSLKSAPTTDCSQSYPEIPDLLLDFGKIEGRWRSLFLGIGYSRQLSMFRVQPIQINGADQLAAT
jgi:hypothetical protein